MPYKHKNIEYGLPHEEYPRERIIECVNTLKETIELSREPVGITFLFTKEDYDKYPVEEIKGGDRILRDGKGCGGEGQRNKVPA